METTCVAHLTTDNLDEAVDRAREAWEWMQADPAFGFDQLVAECIRYNGPWCDIRGVLTIPNADVAKPAHAHPVLMEGLRLMALNIGANGMVVAPSPVDAAMHAAMAQTDWMDRLRDRGYRVRHRTSEEEAMEPYTMGCLTDVFYERVFGEEPPRFMWYDQTIVEARANVIRDQLAPIGILFTEGIGGRVDPKAFAGLRHEGDTLVPSFGHPLVRQLEPVPT